MTKKEREFYVTLEVHRTAGGVPYYHKTWLQWDRFFDSPLSLEEIMEILVKKVKVGLGERA